MPASTDSQAQESDPKARVWLKPEQIDAMRNATVENSADYLATRNDTLIALLTDTGLRVGEAVAVDVSMIDFEDGVLMLPADIQKDYPNDNSPTYTEIELAGETLRTLRTYLSNRWKDSDALFPSRQSDRMTTESVRNVIRDAATDADIEPYTVEGLGDPTDVTPHALRHSVAYRMMNREEGNTLYDVRNRLRHRSIQTTERVYDHLDRV
ncbi:tyrosine-type recombinase/integrase [Halobacterium salinarum]|uniref:tyrosine-type recombinase/integrase n=1 Tax=Halobacterium salinarum TaxID=2242 RepID=UPI002556D1AD|nr:tyrosine-type recombinase/integrase [Halobacterium salinarum]MDL0120378.1 tyrosine-type recombinase/integrase [Halobacterium salinarum]